MNIGICDDEESVRTLMRQYICGSGGADKVYLFEGPSDVKEHLKENKLLDVLFLDIDLNARQDGMALAMELKENAIDEGMGSMSLPLIIFVTGYPERMPEAFSVRAFHFLLKPIDEKAIVDILDEARKTVGFILANCDNRTILCSNDGITFSIRVSDIEYAESFGRKLIFHTKSNDAEVYGRISEMAGELGRSFYQVHRSYVVNMNRIFDYGKQTVTLESGKKIPLSKYKHDEFVMAFTEFLGRKEGGALNAGIR